MLSRTAHYAVPQATGDACWRGRPSRGHTLGEWSALSVMHSECEQPKSNLPANPGNLLLLQVGQEQKLQKSIKKATFEDSDTCVSLTYLSVPFAPRCFPRDLVSLPLTPSNKHPLLQVG